MLEQGGGEGGFSQVADPLLIGKDGQQVNWTPRRHPTGISAAVGAAIAVAAFVGSATPVLAAQDGDQSVIAGIDGLEGLSPEEVALYESDDLKMIRIDASTGAVESVEPLTRAQLDQELRDSDALSTGSATQNSAARGVATGCNSTSPCWYGVGPVYDYSFTLGTTDGTWGNRGNFFTGPYYAKLCWLDPYAFPAGSVTYCMPERNGANAVINLGGSYTGKRVNLATQR